MSDALRQLAAALRCPEERLQAFAVLPPAQLDKLRESIEAAGSRQRAELQKAVDAGLAHVPALLRGAVRRIVQG